MDNSEKLVAAYLAHAGHVDVVYEPDGNQPPDFLVDGRIAVEVRRLNQNKESETGPSYVEVWMDDFEKYLHVKDSDPLVRSFLAHYQFEAIHPFNDGNGLVGRLLLALTIAEWCNLSRPWLYMSPYFERRKQEYMDLLLGVSTHGDWDSWVEFCLEGVVSQARDTEQRCEKLLELHGEFSSRLKGGQRSALVNCR